MSTPALFTPLQLREIRLRNRLAVSPMCQYSAQDGFANHWHLVHLGSRAVGGAGLVIAEATGVLPEGRITPYCLGLWNDAQAAALRPVTDFIRQAGSVAGIQLAHAGRKASCRRTWEGGQPLQPDEGAWSTVAPSATPYRETDPLPQALDKAGIHRIIDAFARAAKRAYEAGFEVVEIHAAHGYLLHQFLSPLSNCREDDYGGSFDNRVRLLREVVRAVRDAWPAQLALFVRISATDWVDGGWTPEDSIALCQLLKTDGADLIDCSSGGNSRLQRIPVGPLYQVPFAERIRSDAGIATGAVGLIHTAAEAESIIADGKADLVLMARQLLRDPYFPLHAAAELGYDMAWPAQYLRAKP